jgi:hypothetical protein
MGGRRNPMGYCDLVEVEKGFFGAYITGSKLWRMDWGGWYLVKGELCEEKYPRHGVSWWKRNGFLKTAKVEWYLRQKFIILHK